MKRFVSIVITFLTLFFNAQVNAQSVKRFDGGMMVHTGYLQDHVSALNYEVQGMTFGLGGALRFHIGNHLRVGGEGYVSTLKQLDNGSYVRIGWGGLLTDAYWCFGRWQPFAGFATGGGKVSSLLMFAGSTDDWISESEAYLHEESFFFVNPNAGVEFMLTDAVHLTFKVDRLIPMKAVEMPVGMRFYAGFIFAH